MKAKNFYEQIKLLHADRLYRALMNEAKLPPAVKGFIESEIKLASKLASETIEDAIRAIKNEDNILPAAYSFLKNESDNVLETFFKNLPEASDPKAYNEYLRLLKNKKSVEKANTAFQKWSQERKLPKLPAPAEEKNIFTTVDEVFNNPEHLSKINTLRTTVKDKEEYADKLLQYLTEDVKLKLTSKEVSRLISMDRKFAEGFTNIFIEIFEHIKTYGIKGFAKWYKKKGWLTRGSIFMLMLGLSAILTQKTAEGVFFGTNVPFFGGLSSKAVFISGRCRLYTPGMQTDLEGYIQDYICMRSAEQIQNDHGVSSSLREQAQNFMKKYEGSLVGPPMTASPERPAAPAAPAPVPVAPVPAAPTPQAAATPVTKFKIKR